MNKHYINIFKKKKKKRTQGPGLRLRVMGPCQFVDICVTL